MNLIDISQKIYNKQPFLKEWGFFVWLIIIVRALTMTFSVFAGYFFYVDIFNSVVGSGLSSKVFTISILSIVELTTIIALSKFFKFLIRKDLKPTLLSAGMALILFTVTFISSSEGLSMRQALKVDIKPKIDTLYNKDRKELRIKMENDIKSIEKLIAVEQQNPLSWKNKLSSSQLVRIENYTKQVSTLRENFKAESAKIDSLQQADLHRNKLTTSKEASKYYNLVICIMLITLLINGLLRYFYSRIAKESSDPYEEIRQKAKEQIQRVFEEAMNFEPAATTTQRVCKFCGKELKSKHWNQHYCNDECKTKFHDRSNTK